MGQPHQWHIRLLVLWLLISTNRWAQADPLPHGVASGEVSATSAMIWARVNGEAGETAFTVEYTVDPTFATVQGRQATTVSGATDFTGTVPLTALQPATRYYYRVRPQSTDNGQSSAGTFMTAPLPEEKQDVIFLWGGDLGGQGFCRQPAYTIFFPMKAMHADFFIFGGDTIYADSPCPSPPNAPGSDFVAKTQEQFWAKHRYQREDRLLRELLATTPLYPIWDDHEVKNDFAGSHEPLTPVGLQAFFDYFPLQRFPAEPHRLYRSARWGQRLEVFLLDNRQYRSANRQADGPDKTMLGPLQLRWLLDGLSTSTATWKVIVSSVPLAAHTGRILFGHDGWGGGAIADGFTTELRIIVTTLEEKQIRNVVWLSTDIHVARFFSYDPNQDGKPDFYEFISGPLSAITGNLDSLDQTFHPTILYEETNFFNFGVVKVNGKSGAFTVEIRDQEGKVHQALTLKAE
jgi:alkaline phosphatase D